MAQRDNSLRARLKELGAATLMLPLGPFAAGIVIHDNHAARAKRSEQALPAWQAYVLDPLKILGIFWRLFVTMTPFCLLRLPFASDDE